MMRRWTLGRGPWPRCQPFVATLGRSSTQPPTRGMAGYAGEMSRALRFELTYPTPGPLHRRALRGRPVLVVNTASKCLHAPQLRGLQELYERYHPRGLEIVAVPSNDFDGKEPGSDVEIVMVYTRADDFKVTFPIAQKASVTGPKAHAFFDEVARRYGRSVAPTWNFDKFLVDAFGDLCAVFPHDTDPLVPEVIEAIEDALADMPPPRDDDADEFDDDDDDDDDDEEYDDDGDDEDEEEYDEEEKKRK